MRTKQLLVSLAALCAIATVAGCASTDRQASQNSLDATNLNRNGRQFSAEFSQSVFEKWFAGSTGDPLPTPSRDDSPAPPIFEPGSQQVNLNQLAFQKPDLATNGAATLDERHRFDTSAGPRENFGALDESGDSQINWTEFLKQATKHSKRYHFFADTDKINDGYVPWDKELFRQPGWQLFSIQF